MLAQRTTHVQVLMLFGFRCSCPRVPTQLTSSVMKLRRASGAEAGHFGTTSARKKLRNSCARHQL